MSAEHLRVPGEVRAEGRTLHGVVMRYGEVARDRRERFEKGSLMPSAGAWVEFGHDAARVLAYRGGGVEFRDVGDKMTMTAELPEIPLADLALQEVREGIRTGLSVRFRSMVEKEEDGVRVIERALLQGVGLVREGSYSGAGVTEVRQRRLTARVPIGQAIDCRCSGPDCDSATIAEINLDEDVLGYFGDFSKPLGPARSRIRGGAVEVEVEVAEKVSYADDLRELVKGGTAPVVRPYPDPRKSRTRKEGRTLVYDHLQVAGWIVSFTDQRGGLADAELRRVLRWL